jgi:hypothetical protein
MGVLFDYFSDASPLVQLGTLEALLTRRDYALIVAGSRAGHALA